MKIKLIPIDKINVGERRRDDYGDIEGLAASIAEFQLFSPIIVDDQNNLIAGARRLVACTTLEWTEIPCRLYSDLDEEERRRIELEENDQRKDLTPFEKSKKLLRLAQPVETAGQTEFRKPGLQKSKGRPKSDSSLRTEAARAGVSAVTIQKAKQHVAAVEERPELKSASQRTALAAVKKAPLAKPGIFKKASAKWNDKLADVRSFVSEIRNAGGGLAITGRWTDQERMAFFNELTDVRDRMSAFVDEFQSYFDDLKEQAG